MELNYEPHWEYPSGGCLAITDNCNLQCHYCFVEQHPKNMTLDMAKQAVDFLYNNYQIKKQNNFYISPLDPFINFFGGEPTLLWDEIIVPLTLYIEKKYENFHIGITTNGTLLNEEKIKFLNEHKISILLSIDGDKTTQDLTRPCKDKTSSFDKIIKNIPLLLQYQPNIVFRATVSQENVDQLFHNFLFAKSLGFKEWFFSPNEREKWSEDNLITLEEQVNKIFQYYLLLFQNNINVDFYSSLIDNSFRQAINIYDFLLLNNNLKINKIPIYFSRCGIGTGTISINCDGDIFGCQEQNSRNNSNFIFKIGNLKDGINKDKQLKLIQSFINSDIKCENPKVCDNCKFSNECRVHMCPSTCYDLFNSFNQKTEVACRYRNAFTNNALLLIKLLNNNQIFLDYLKDIERRTLHYNGDK